MFEAFFKERILEDISSKIDIGQYGGQAGTGTEHMMVFLVDRILKLLDSTNERAAVIASLIDWANAFDRLDPTLAIEKFIQMGVRASIIPLLCSYLENRKMRVKYKGELSEEHTMVGGGPQGTLLGLIEYLVQSNDAAACISDDDRFKYIDDLSILELVFLAGVLTEFDCHSTVPSDIATDQLYLPPQDYATQTNLDSISAWTNSNLMKINASKTNYIIFTRAKVNFGTRLHVNGVNLDRVEQAKIVGVWLTSDMKWEKNTRELSIKAYSRLGMLTKLKYVGVEIDDLLDIFVLYIRSVLEYCSVVWHSSLTQELSSSLEMVQKTCLKIILGDNYVSYSAALEMCNLKTLARRREERCLTFAQRCLKHPLHSRMFPLNENNLGNKHLSREKYSVNFAKTDTYKMSAVPYLQRRLNAK